MVQEFKTVGNWTVLEYDLTKPFEEPCPAPWLDAPVFQAEGFERWFGKLLFQGRD